MPHREVSPTLSESGFDLTSALIPDAASDVGSEFQAHVTVPSPADALKSILSDDDDDAAFIAAKQVVVNKAAAKTSKSAKKTGAFQSMGLNPALLKAITRKGFSVPTPIQRKTIPIILDGQDVVGMARTGSGKTAAFVIPMIEKLKTHSVQVGARAIVMSPSRELALQTLKAIKEFGKGTDLRTVLLVGGESFEEQFSQMTSNPDIIIATPGRFLHLQVEMNLDLSSIRYLVFDEADRLFEQGFAVQLTEILHKLPASRQTLLFSATLPKTLVEFAKAGLQEPSLVRLDAESKISPDLESAFLTMKSSDKEGALLHILQDVIKIPLEQELQASAASDAASNPKKRKRSQSATTNANTDTPTQHSTIIFAATKHHVEYLSTLLRAANFAVSYVYGTLDQTARRQQVDSFRSGTTNILVVTDVAARGIDIPLLANVINYDFPSQPKIFVHRVGRTARAGRKGWSYNFLQDSDLPYLLDLQLFMGKSLIIGRQNNVKPNFGEDLVLGGIPRSRLERCNETVIRYLAADDDLVNLRDVAGKGEKLYQRTRNSASAESAKRAKIVASTSEYSTPNMLYDDENTSSQTAKEDMLKRIAGFRPQETVFEMRKKGETTEVGEVVRKRREKMRMKAAANAAAAPKIKEADDAEENDDDADFITNDDTAHFSSEDDDNDEPAPTIDAYQNDDNDNLEVSFPASKKHQRSHPSASQPSTWADPDVFLTYTPRTHNLHEDRGYSLTDQSASNFASAASGATMDLDQDESSGMLLASKSSQMRWDKKGKKYVSRANDADGSKGKGGKMVRGESGVKIPASLRSGIFEDWKRKNRVERMPRVGEKEMTTGRGGIGGSGRGGRGGGRFMHYKEREAKKPDKYRDDYEVKKRKFDEKRMAAMGGGDVGGGGGHAEGGGGGRGGGASGGRGGSARGGRGESVARGGRDGRGGFGGGPRGGGRPGGKPKSELRGVDDVRKERAQKQQRRDKNARPARRGRG